ncbi:MAG: hypothetical protein K0S24_241 [Sphingobacterium sp.]|jgi:hypothetical protein|nr:hypothetical protein [Sphingobacterium sp.]
MGGQIVNKPCLRLKLITGRKAKRSSKISSLPKGLHRDEDPLVLDKK